MNNNLILKGSEIPRLLYEIHDILNDQKSAHKLNNNLYDCLILKMDLEKSKTIVDKILNILNSELLKNV
tara:strand:- start:278 stop:484 length:207 start_codon:yes stop_codon:yes gene_type:complete